MQMNFSEGHLLFACVASACVSACLIAASDWGVSRISWVSSWKVAKSMSIIMLCCKAAPLHVSLYSPFAEQLHRAFALQAGP